VTTMQDNPEQGLKESLVENSNAPIISDNEQITELQNVLSNPRRLDSDGQHGKGTNKNSGKEPISDVSSGSLSKFNNSDGGDNPTFLKAVEVLDKFTRTRSQKCNFSFPILRGINDGSNEKTELIPIVELENPSEDLTNSTENYLRQHINRVSLPIYRNSFFTKEAYEKYSQYSLRRVHEMSVAHQKINNNTPSKKSDDVICKGTSGVTDKENSIAASEESPILVDRENPNIIDKENPKVDKENLNVMDKEIQIINEKSPEIIFENLIYSDDGSIYYLSASFVHEHALKSSFFILDDLMMDDQSDRDDVVETTVQRKNSEPKTQGVEVSVSSIVEQSPKLLTQSPGDGVQSTVKEAIMEDTSSVQLKTSADKKKDEKLQGTESKDSYDIIGPYLQLLEKHKKQSEKSNLKRDSNNSVNSRIPITSTLADTASVPSDASYNSSMTLMPHSKMSHEQHINFLRLTLLSETNPTLLTEPDWSFINVMKERFKEEREEYIQWLYNRSQDRLVYLDSKISNQLERFYEVLFTMGLALPPPGPDEPVLIFNQTIKRIGTCYKFGLQLPTPSQILKIPLERDYMLYGTNSSDNNHVVSADSNNNDVMDVDDKVNSSSSDDVKIPKRYWQKMSMPVVSRDPLISSMVTQYKVNVVMSSSSLCALVALQASADIEFELPIRVVESKDADKILKTVYIDKPLPKRSITPRQRNQIFYDIAFESVAFDSGIDVNEVFNNSVGNNLVFKPPLALKRVDDTSRIVGRVKMMLAESQLQLHKKLQKSRKNDKHMDDESQTNVGDSDRPVNPMRLEMLSDDHLRSGNLIYNLWNFGDMVILIRCKAHAYIQESNNDNKKGDPHASVYRSANPSSPTNQTQSSTELHDRPSTILSEVTTHFYDLHRAHSQSPLLDLKTIPFVPIKWSGLQNQVPYTFPIRPPEKRFVYCFDFMRFGKCDKTDCIYPHLTKEQCELSGIKTNHCFAFVDTGKCENRNCHYAHIPKDQIEGIKSTASSKKPKKKKSKAKKGETSLHEGSINPLDLDDKNVVENLGTSLTPDFETLLRRFVTIYVVFAGLPVT
ncbi:12811_t:CDS:10, partial [Acaulospora colombiana]